jgi:hypothetical protein
MPERPVQGLDAEPGLTELSFRQQMSRSGLSCGGLAAQYTTGLITRLRLAFALRWSLRRRQHQATARWHHYSARLLAASG